MSSCRIRLFERRDTDAVVKLAGDYAAFDRAMPKDWLLSTYDKYPESIWVAEAGDELVGFIIGYETETPLGINRGRIELLAVHPSWRRRGIGTRLVEKILEQFQKMNLRESTLFCPASASEAKRFYERLGFEVNAYFMGREL